MTTPKTQDELLRDMERDYNGGNLPIWCSPASRRNIEDTGMGWHAQPCCRVCTFCWQGDVKRMPANYAECWHPDVKWEKPFPHGPGIHFDGQFDGVCPKFQEKKP